MKEYDEKCDIWSCGVILYILLCGYPPFAGADRGTVLKSVLKAEVKFNGSEWKLVSLEAKDLIRRMLTKNPQNRPSARDVFHHPWIQMRGNALVKDKLLNYSTLNNLTRFCAGCKLQLASLTFLAYRLSSNRETTDLQKLFKSLDLNGDGKLSKEELNIAFSRLATSESIDIDRIMQRCDSNKNGYIDFTEFLTASIDWKQALSGERLEALFKELDKDNDGAITIEEIKIFLGGSEYIDDQEWEEIFREADYDHNGVIDLEEFRSVMLSEFKIY
jgi:calcium-dependent protein kinase